MLKNNFFFPVGSITGDDGTIKATIRLIKTHPIFAGHFPGLPIVPGVCMMAMIKEVLEEKVNRPLQLQTAANIKFLSLIDPMKNEQVDIEIKYKKAEGDSFISDGIIVVNNHVFFKITGAVYH